MNIFKKATEYSVQSVADIISYLIVQRHVTGTAPANIHSPSERYAQSNWSHLEL
jgi:hypothetical protein